MHFTGASVLLALVAACAAEQWRWPEGAASVRIDTKVHFDSERDRGGRQSATQADDVPFKEPTETEGFYNRPPGAGRYPVRVETHRLPYQAEGHAIYPVKKGPKNFVSDGTLDSLQYCRCLTTPDCNPRPDSASACGYGKFLCCYKKPNNLNHLNTEFFNEVDDERPILLPGQENVGRPFPPPPETEPNEFFGPEFGHESTLNQQGVLVGPDGPTGIVGPQKKPLLTGPNGPTGIIGPHQKPVLVGPGGPTGTVGPSLQYGEPRPSESAQRGVLVGPGGPTGVIGPYGGGRPVLVGPGGPTGIIGPRRSPGVLVGQGGPTGIVGPYGHGRRQRPGVLVGPEGPTGVIGPGRQILVGPDGPTGRIGPQGYYGK